MVKLSDYEFERLGQNLVDFKDDVLDLLNNGKYQVGNAGGGFPTYNAQRGEMALSVGVTTAAFYLATSTNTWRLVTTFPL